jgi:hypothetical protein
MKLAATAHDIFTLTRECLAMREAIHGDGPQVDQDRREKGWRRFDPKALASLTDQQIREMARAWLDRTLAEDWERRLLREHIPQDPEKMRDNLTRAIILNLTGGARLRWWRF